MTTANRFCDELEPRRFLSADVVNGTLVVVGTNGPDRIAMWEDVDKGPTIVVIVEPLLMGRPPEQYEIPADGVHSILVRGLAGDDDVNLVDAPLGPTTGPVSIPSRIDAGLGNDAITGGNARDTILGGFGNDTISGGAGNDFILGGWGNDTLWGDAGNDIVSGNYGDDRVYGNEGDDRLYGGAGNDKVGFNGVGPAASEPGNDVLVGGPGEDRLVGGEGKDRIYGGTGRDHFSPQDDDSEMLDRTPDEPKDIPQFR